MKSIVVVAVAVLSTAGCFLKPSWTNGPVESPEGVRVRMVGHMCWDAEGGHHWADAPRELLLKLAVENTTDQLLRVDKEAVSVVVGDDHARVQPTGARVLEVKPHAAETVEWTFGTHTDCHTERTFVVGLRDAMSLGDKPTAVANLEFKP